MEESNADEERSQYVRYDNIRKVKSPLFDHTNDNNLAGTDGYAQRLSGGESERFGLARSISVMPGDKVKAEVYAKYVDVNSTDLQFP